MAVSLAIIIILGLLFNKVFNKLRLPGLLGMLLLGVLIGPYGFDILNQEILNISGDLRKIALIIILLRAGLGIEKETLKKVGLPAIKLSFIPGVMEGFTLLFTSILIFDLSIIEAGMLAFIIAAVSPAVVVPQMLDLIKDNRGTKKGIPTLILTGASIDDVIAITVFSTFLGFHTAKNINIKVRLLSIPISIILGILFGIIFGFIMIYLFKKFHIRDTKKALIILGSAILLTGLEGLLKGIIPVASLLGVMAIGFILQSRYKLVATRLASKFNKIWIFAEIMLFVLVGAEVNIQLTFESGFAGLSLILIGLIARSIGVLISLINTDFNLKERFFSVIVYTPKATVQAAIGAVPLAYGVKSGELILAIAVLAIIITAPLGAAGIKYTGYRWLKKEEKQSNKGA